MMNWNDHMNGWGGWGFGLMTISMVLFWGLLILAAVALFRYLGRSEHRSGGVPPARPAAEDLLAERFARGEIDVEEYEQRLAALRGVARAGHGG